MKKMSGKEALLTAVAEAIEMLPLDFDKIDTDNPAKPRDSVIYGEKVVGIMTDNQKVLFTALEQITNKLQTTNDGTLEVARFNASREVLKNLLFVSINNTFNLYDTEGGSGFRKDYRVVSFGTDHQLLPPPLQALFAIMNN